MTIRVKTRNSLEEGPTGRAGGTYPPWPGLVVDNDVQRSIEGFVKCGRGHSLLIRMNRGDQCPIICEMVAAGSFSREALKDYRKLPNAREIRPLSSQQSRDDLTALKERNGLEDLRCVLVARQRTTASRAVVLGYLTGEQTKPLRQYWWTNLRRAFPTKAQKWFEESWETGISSATEEHGNSPTRLSDPPEYDLTGVNTARTPIDAGEMHSLRRGVVEGHAQEAMLDDSPCLEPGIQTPIITKERPPSLEQMPGEILNMILEHSFDFGSSLEMPHQIEFYNIVNASQRLRAGAIDYIPKRARQLVGTSWLRSTEVGHNELFSSTVLQRIESIRLDLSDLADNEVVAIEPHIQRLASIWGKGHKLSSVSVLVRPDWMRLFFRGEIHMVPHPIFTKTLSPLVDLLGDKLNWEPHDFDGPSLPNGDSVLSFAASSEDFGHIPNVLLEKYRGNANATRAPFGYNALHNAAIGPCLDNARALLRVQGLDVDARDTLLGNTPLMNAAVRGWGDMVKLLLVEGKADSSLRNRLDQTPLVIAEMARHRHVVDLLRKAHAIDI